MTTKAVSYSYPSSPNAQRFGFKAGCFCVYLSHGGKPPVCFSGFSTLKEALETAGALSFPWSPYTLKP